MQENYLTPNRAAILLGVSRTTVWNWIKKGKLRHIKIDIDGERPHFLISQHTIDTLLS